MRLVPKPKRKRDMDRKIKEAEELITACADATTVNDALVRLGGMKKSAIDLKGPSLYEGLYGPSCR
jgi:hypothetical protein